MSVTNYDFSSVPWEIAEEMCRQGEIMIQGMLQVAVAADQRAVTLTGIFGGASIAMFAVAATIIAADEPSWDLIYSATATALLLFVAAMIAARAAMPSLYYIGGYEPKRLASSRWENTHEENKEWLWRYVAEDIQKRIDFNNSALRKAAKRVTTSINIGLFSIFFGTALFLVLRQCH